MSTARSMVAALALLPLAAAPAHGGVDDVGVGECTVTTELARSESCTIVADSTALMAQCRGVGGGTGYYRLSTAGQQSGETHPCDVDGMASGTMVFSLVPPAVATITVVQTNATGYVAGTLS